MSRYDDEVNPLQELINNLHVTLDPIKFRKLQEEFIQEHPELWAQAMANPSIKSAIPTQPDIDLTNGFSDEKFHMAKSVPGMRASH